MSRTMALIGLLYLGPTMHHHGSWRHPESDVDGVLDPARYEHLARVYERGLFDGVFIVDGLAISDIDPCSPNSGVAVGNMLTMLDPLQMLAVMARATRHLGLAATLSTTYNDPFVIARKFATLDHISGGRSGWNIVTSSQPAEARALGRDNVLPAEQRYDHADEVLELCLALWESWDADALIIDREKGRFADPAKVHPVTYSGATVKSSGLPNTPRSPQGRPVFMQAGASSRGREFAARWAEVIFTHQRDKSAMRSFYDDIKSRMDARGRPRQHCAILPAIGVVVGDSESEAKERADYVDSFAIPNVEQLELIMGCSLEGWSLDTPLTELPVGPNGPPVMGAYDNWMGMRENGRPLTLGEAALLHATTHGLPRFVGDVTMVVDQMQDLFESRACDGFVLAQPLSPGDVEIFVDKVVPELQRRGLYRTEYRRTFRENILAAMDASDCVAT